MGLYSGIKMNGNLQNALGPEKAILRLVVYWLRHPIAI